MNTLETGYIVVACIAAIFFMVHIWEEIKDTYTDRREEIDRQYYDGEITVREYEARLFHLGEEMKKSA